MDVNTHSLILKPFRLEGEYWSPYLATERPKFVSLWKLRHTCVFFVLYMSEYITFPGTSRRCSKSKAWSVTSQAKTWVNSMSTSITHIQPVTNLFVKIHFYLLLLFSGNLTSVTFSQGKHCFGNSILLYSKVSWGTSFPYNKEKFECKVAFCTENTKFGLWKIFEWRNHCFQKWKVFTVFVLGLEKGRGSHKCVSFRGRRWTLSGDILPACVPSKRKLNYIHETL